MFNGQYGIPDGQPRDVGLHGFRGSLARFMGRPMTGGNHPAMQAPSFHTGGPAQVQPMPQFNTGGQLPPPQFQPMTGGYNPPQQGYPMTGGQYPASSGGLARMFSTYRGF